jgi:hypothetical protein
MIFKRLSFFLIAASAMMNLNYSYAADPSLQFLTADQKQIKKITLEEMKRNYDLQTVETQTPWSSGKVVTYRGAPFFDVLKDAHFESKRQITAIALNDYVTNLNVNEIKQYNPILATEIKCSEDDAPSNKCNSDGFRPLNAKEYGPIFVVWPYKNLSNTDDPRDHSRWVWFLAGIQQID